MSRNSIRLIKGQNRIELIYRVNSESLKMKEKIKKAYELDFFWHTNCLWTEEEPYSLSSGNLLPRWLGEEVPTETAPVVSMINIFLFAPVTTPPLNANYVSEVLSQIQSFYAKKGRLGAPPPLLWCTPSVRKNSWRSMCSVLTSDMFHLCRRWPCDVLFSHISIRSSCLRILTLSAISRSTRGEEVCYFFTPRV